MAVGYDSAAFTFFAITLLALYVLPAGWYIIRTVRTWNPTAAERAKGRTRDEERKLVELENSLPKPVLWTRGFKIFVGITLAAVAVLAVLLLQASTSAPLASYDPYAILGVEGGASEREIKTAYRKLSLVHHPDKPGGNAELFQKIAKAYEALSDPEARANWEKFGNPDGQGTMEVSIGLPPALVGPIGKYIFLGGYVLLLVAVLPYLMFRRWKSTPKAKMLHGVEQESAGVIHSFMGVGANQTTPPVPLHVLQALDVLAALKEGSLSEAPSVEDKGEIDRLTGLMMRKEQPKPAKKGAAAAPSESDGSLNVMPTGVTIPINQAFLGQMQFNRVLLYAHMHRLPIERPALRAHLQKLLAVVPDASRLAALIASQRTREEYQQYKQARAMGKKPPRRNVDYSPTGDAWLELAARLSAAIGIRDPSADDVTAAMPGSNGAISREGASILQVFTAKQWQQLVAADEELGREEGKAARFLKGARTLSQFLSLPSSNKEKAFSLIADREEREEARSIAESMPVLQVRARLGLQHGEEGEDEVSDMQVADGAATPAKRNPRAPLGSAAEGPSEWGGEEAGSKVLVSGGHPHVHQEDVLTLRLRLKHANVKGATWDQRDSESALLPYAYSPYLPGLQKETWIMSVGVSVNGGESFDMFAQPLTPERALETVEEMKFPAVFEGQNTFTIKLSCASYLGLEQSHQVTMTVLPKEDAKGVSQASSESVEGGDEDEDEEDSDSDGEEGSGDEEAGAFGLGLVGDKSMEAMMRSRNEDLSDVSDEEEGEGGDKKGRKIAVKRGTAQAQKAPAAAPAAKGKKGKAKAAAAEEEEDEFAEAAPKASAAAAAGGGSSAPAAAASKPAGGKAGKTAAAAPAGDFEEFSIKAKKKGGAAAGGKGKGKKGKEEPTPAGADAEGEEVD